MERVLVPYSEARPLIRNADQLLWSPSDAWGPAGIFSRGIAGGPDGFAHAAKVMFVGKSKRLIVIEMEGRYGCRTVPLSTYVSQESGKIHVYQPNAGNLWPHYSRATAIDQMFDILAKPYPWHQIRMMHWARIARGRGLMAWFARMIGFGTIYGTDEPGDENKLVCSGACAWADRQRDDGGKLLADPFPKRACRSVEPNDFAKSPFYRYKFTLTKDEPMKEGAL